MNKQIEKFKNENKNFITQQNETEVDNGNEQMQEYDHDMEIFIKRNSEIEELVKSIVDLNQIFKDLSLMINEQSESIDRIDMVMGEVVTKTDNGVKELQKAQEEQKKCVIQ